LNLTFKISIIDANFYAESVFLYNISVISVKILIIYQANDEFHESANSM
jgi:hypothetical protein